MLRMPWDSTLQLPWRHRLPYRLPYRLPSPTCSITELMAVVAELKTAKAAAKAAAGGLAGGVTDRVRTELCSIRIYFRRTRRPSTIPIRSRSSHWPASHTSTHKPQRT